MRLPWPLGRRPAPDGPSSHGADSDDTRTAVPVEPDASRADAVAPPTGAWATLPPIERASGDPPLVAPSAPFLADVPGHRALPPVVGRLGHDTGPTAPPGLVAAHAVAVPALTSSAPLTPRHVQRQAAGNATLSAQASGAAEDAGAEPGSTQVPAAPAGAGDGAADAPLRRLPAVSPAATVTPSPQPLTAAPPHLTALGGRRKTSAPAGFPEPPVQRAASSAAESPATGAAPRWSETPSRTTPDAMPAATPGTPAGPPVRRPGLGAPLPSAPPSAVAQRQAADAAPSSSPSLSRVAARRGAQSAPPAPSTPDTALAPAPEPASAPEPPAARPLPTLPVVSRRSAAESTPAFPTTAVGAPGTSPATAAAPPSAGGSGPVMPSAELPRPAPLGGARPVRAAAPVQRAVPRDTTGAHPLRPAIAPLVPVTPPAGAASTASPDGPAADAPVTARWAPAPSLPALITAVPPADASVAAASPAAARSATAAAPGAPPANEIVFPPREPASELPGWASAPVAPPFEVQRSAAGPSRAAAADPGLSLARPRPAFTPAAQGGPAVAWSQAASAPQPVGIVAGPAASGAPVVQASRATGASPLAVTATPVVQRVDGAAPSAPSAPAERSEAELDELARSLFGRIRNQLRTDVLHDREARGLPFDAF